MSAAPAPYNDADVGEPMARRLINNTSLAPDETPRLRTVARMSTFFPRMLPDEQDDPTPFEIAPKPPLGQRLTEVAGQAVDKLDEIMGLRLDADHPTFPSILRAQTTAASAALATQVKVDDLALRKQPVDRMPELLKLVEEVQKTLPPPGPIDFEAEPD
jgi:hypothetical protein